MPSIAGEQPQLCRSTAGDPSSRSLRSQGRHSDGNATAPPDSAAVPVVFPGCYVFTTHSLRCGCAGRSYRSHSTSQLHELMGARRTTRTRRVHPASSWHQSRTGMSQSCAPKHPSNLAHSDGNCASGWAHSRLELGAASAGRSVRTAQPASCMLVVLCMRNTCRELAAAGLLLESRCRRHVCAVPPRSCDSDHDCSPEWPPRASVWWGWQTYCGVTSSSRHRGGRSSGSGCSGRIRGTCAVRGA